MGNELRPGLRRQGEERRNPDRNRARDAERYLFLPFALPFPLPFPGTASSRPGTAPAQISQVTDPSQSASRGMKAGSMVWAIGDSW